MHQSMNNRQEKSEVLQLEESFVKLHEYVLRGGMEVVRITTE